MWTLRISLAVFAAMLLVATVNGKPADADNCYATLADYLYKATKSTVPAQNIEQAGSLLSARPNADEKLTRLVQAFGSLEGDTNNAESFCSKMNLANLRQVTESLRDGGNLGPNEITRAILRLNKIVITLIDDARRVCEPFLNRKLPFLSDQKFSDPTMKMRINYMAVWPLTNAYEGFYFYPSIKPREFDYTLSIPITNGLHHDNLAQPELLDTVDTDVIIEQLDKYVYKPCKELVALDEAREVLEPSNDLLKIWYAASTRLLDQYHTNNDISRLDPDKYHHYSSYASDLAYSYQVCQVYLTIPKQQVAERISRYRTNRN